MVTLASFLARRRWWVVAAWLVTVIVAAPLAAKQTEHLSGGGFDVPGSQSQTVETAAAARFASNEAGRLGVVLQPSPGVAPEQAAAATKRLERQVAAAGDGVRLAPGAAARAEAQLAAGKPVI